MEFIVNKAIFSDALSLISTVVPERSARIILQNLMLTGNSDNSITLAATDLEIGIKISVEVKDMRDPCQLLLPASRLNLFVKDSYAEELKVTVQDNKAEIKTKRGRFQIAGQDSIDYPSIPDFKPEGAVFIHGDDLIDAIRKTVFATAKGDTRYALNGIYLNITESLCEFVASDTHRLSLVKKKVRNPHGATTDGIVITKGMTALERLADGVDMVELNMSANELCARTPNASIIIRRVEGMFPRYNDVIPAKSECVFTVNREELMHSLHAIRSTTTDESKSVVFSISEGGIRISGANEIVEGYLDIDAEVSGEAIDIKFNYLFLIEALKNIDSEKATVQYKDGENPARIDVGDFMYVIMPINR